VRPSNKLKEECCFSVSVERRGVKELAILLLLGDYVADQVVYLLQVRI
jgi:hypothetical protein